MNSLEGIVHNNYIVDLRQRTCDCGIFEMFKYPCAHVFAACAPIHFDVMTLVDPVYRLENVFKVYRNKFPPIENECDPNMIDNEPKILPDPSLQRDPRGRSHSTRIYCADDMIAREPTIQPTHCTSCRKLSYNKNKCPLRTGPRIN
ncbi:hypothetical protein GQ457_01G009390 [Hibiscus cannabinus]